MYLISLLLPAIGSWNDSLWGWQALMLGWLALTKDPNPAWLANIVLLFVVVTSRKKMHSLSSLFSCDGFVLALVALNVDELAIGAHLWLLSFSLLFAASIWAWSYPLSPGPRTALPDPQRYIAMPTLSI